MRVVELGSSLAECIEEMKYDFVALNTHFRYSANSASKLNCSNDISILRQKERDEENVH